MSYQVCKVCGRNLVTINKPGFKPFLGCEMWDAEHKKAKEAYKASKALPHPITAPTAAPNNVGQQMMMEELQGIRKEMNERLDAMAQYLAKKLG